MEWEVTTQRKRRGVVRALRAVQGAWNLLVYSFLACCYKTEVWDLEGKHSFWEMHGPPVCLAWVQCLVHRTAINNECQTSQQARPMLSHTTLQDFNRSWRIVEHPELKKHNHQRVVFWKEDGAGEVELESYLMLGGKSVYICFALPQQTIFTQIFQREY